MVAVFGYELQMSSCDLVAVMGCLVAKDGMECHVEPAVVHFAVHIGQCAHREENQAFMVREIRATIEQKLFDAVGGAVAQREVDAVTKERCGHLVNSTF